MILDLSNCGPSGFLRVIYFFKLILDIAFIIIPIALIILLMIDLAKTVISNEEKVQKTTGRMFFKRILYTVLIFFVPTFVDIVFLVLGDLGVDYAYCYDNVNIDEINYLDSVEFSCRQAENYVSKAEILLTNDSFDIAQEYINKVLDEEIKVNLQNRLDIAREYGSSKEHENSNNNLEYDDFSSIGNCTPGSKVIVFTSEPDPSCAINYWKLGASNYVYPKIKGKLLGAWPKDFASIPTKIDASKVYQNGKLIWPVTPVKGSYSFVYEHNGIDIMSNFGTPIYSPVSGKLRYSQWGNTVNKGSDETAYSISIVLDEPINYDGASYSTMYLTHMSGIVYNCSSVQDCNRNINKGELLGFVGTAAGSATTGGFAPHLHMTLHKSNDYDSGVMTTKFQKLYNLDCGKNCKNIEKKAGE